MKKPKFEKLNIGCGTDIRKGFLNLDCIKFKGVDIVRDLNKMPLPFKENSFSHVLMSHVLEHVNEPVDLMKEVWRISKPNALIYIEVPYFSSLNAVKDPTHKTFFAAATFDFFERGKLGNGNYFDSSSDFNFKIIRKEIIFSENKFLRIFNPLFNISQRIYERFFAHILPSSYLKVRLKVIKNHQ